MLPTDSLHLLGAFLQSLAVSESAWLQRPLAQQVAVHAGHALQQLFWISSFHKLHLQNFEKNTEPLPCR